MNEFLFLLHIGVALGATFFCLRLGRVALTAGLVLQAILANLFVLKQTTLFGLEVTCSDVFAIAGILSLNLLQERYGKEAAEQGVRLSLFGLLWFALMSQIHLSYSPSSLDTTQVAYRAILGAAPRLIGASIATFYLVQRWDVWFFGQLTRGSLPLRVGLSLVLSQFLDTVLFSVLGLYGQVASLFDIIAFSFLVKGAVIVCSAAFVRLLQRVKSRDFSV